MWLDGLRGNNLQKVTSEPANQGKIMNMRSIWEEIPPTEVLNE